MTRAFALAFLLLASPAVAQEDHDHDATSSAEHADDHDDHDAEHAEDDHAHVAEADGLRAVHAWTRATDGDTAYVFVEIENTGDAAATLIGAASDRAEAASLVGFAMSGGEETWHPIDRMPVSAGREMMLEPGALAIRLTGLGAPLEEGGDLDVTLLTDRDEIVMEVEIGAEDATRHSHAGHAH